MEGKEAELASISIRLSQARGFIEIARRDVVSRAAAVVAAAAVALVAAAAAGGREARMLVTAYCLRGHTATGTAVHWGSIAVDPTVIPLGTRLWVAGYGYGVAEDTGAAVRGYHVDVWMPSCSAALRSTHYGVVRWR